MQGARLRLGIRVFASRYPVVPALLVGKAIPRSFPGTDSTPLLANNGAYSHGFTSRLFTKHAFFFFFQNMHFKRTFVHFLKPC